MMNRAYRAMDFIGDDLIERSRPDLPALARPRTALWVKSVAVAACAAIVIGGGAYLAGHPYKEDSYSMEALKKLPLTYSVSDDRVFLPVASYVNQFFNDRSNRGFIAEIVPLEYTFYYTMVKREDDGEFYLGGYAESRCSIKKISQKYNLSEYSDQEIIIRQDVFLMPMFEDDSLELEMLESIGAAQNGSCVEGTYKVPGKLINENDFELYTREENILLLGDQSFYSLIAINNDISYLCYAACEDLNGYGSNIPEYIAQSMTDFKEFLVANDPELLD